jgi:hypothetical protein
MQNTVDCYGSGQKTEHFRLYNTLNSWCNMLGSAGIVLRENFLSNTIYLPRGFGVGIKIVTLLKVDQGCQ